MAETRSEVRREIESTKQRIDTQINQLATRADAVADRASRSLSLEHHMKERPVMLLGAAVGVGFLLGRRRGGKVVRRGRSQGDGQVSSSPSGANSSSGLSSVLSGPGKMLMTS
ncbi:MAG: hypothetical protein AAGA56_25255, partial [Myxococcota bacterium]